MVLLYNEPSIFKENISLDIYGRKFIKKFTHVRNLTTYIAWHTKREKTVDNLQNTLLSCNKLYLPIATFVWQRRHFPSLSVLYDIYIFVSSAIPFSPRDFWYKSTRSYIVLGLCQVLILFSFREASKLFVNKIYIMVEMNSYKYLSKVKIISH